MFSTVPLSARVGAHALALLACSLASAQTLVSRASDIRFNAVYGGGPDVWTPNVVVPDATLLAADIETLDFTDSQSGHILGDPERPWSAEVEIAARHEYEITGPLNDFSRIDASGRTVAGAAASGEGHADLTSANPGNQVTFYFNLSAPHIVRLRGLTQFVADGFGGADIRLERFDGFSWALVYWTAFLPGGQGPFDSSLDLAAGEYRIFATAHVHVFAGVRPVHDSRFSYRLTVGECPGDLDGDLDCDLADLAALLSNFGVASGATLGQGDLDADGDVDLADLSELLSRFGTNC